MRRPHHQPLFVRHVLCSHENNVYILLDNESVDENPMDIVDHLSAMDINDAFNRVHFEVFNILKLNQKYHMLTREN